MPAPQNLVASAGNGGVALSWDPANTTVDEFWIYRATQGDMELWTTLGNITHYADNGLVNGLTYRYAVQALGPAGRSNLSEEVSATPRTVPLAPLNPRAIPGNRYLLLTWDLPAFDGGSAITEYRVYEEGGLVGNSTTNEFVHSLLIPREAHTYVVRAVNEAGESPASASFLGIPDVPPGPPSNLSVTGGANNVTLVWDRPLDNGGSEPCGYNVYRAAGAAPMEALISLNASLYSYIDYGLESGSSYRYRVSSFNLVGEGELTEVITVNVLGTGSVRITSIIEGDGEVGIFWQGEGEGIIRYWAYRGPSNLSMEIISTDITENQFWDRGLVNGVEYHYRIGVETLAGLELSENLTAVPHTVPDRPQALAAEGELGYIRLNWSAPADDGGAEVLGYKVYMSSDGRTPGHLADVQGTGYICSGLSEGSRYLFQVSAVNRAGEGERSGVVNETCGLVPSAPDGPSAEAGDGYVVLSWSAPQRPGTGGVSSYEVLRSGSSGEVLRSVSALSLNDTLVSNGVSYTYRIRAVNQVGPGDWSGEMVAIPTWNGDRPGKVMNLTASPGVEHIMLTWSVPDDGGQPIIRYDLYRGLGPDMLVFMASVWGNWYNDTELPTQVTYYYQVVAVNVVGDGAASDMVNATTALAKTSEEDSIWSTFISGAMPVVITVLLIALTVTFYLGRMIFFRGRRKEGNKPKDGGAKGKAAAPPKPRPPQPGNGRK